MIRNILPRRAKADRKLPQSRDTRLNLAKTKWGSIRYLYRRKHDHHIGQDYLAYKFNKERVTFAVCDGVSTSYSGRFAAKFLGDALIKWLSSIELPIDDASLRKHIHHFLSVASPYARELERAIRLPRNLTHAAQTVEDDIREKVGSETTFAACTAAVGTSEGIPSIAAAWMGDTRIHIKQSGQWLNFDEWTDQNRWSTRRGVAGTLSVWTGELYGEEQVVAYTDGLAVLDRWVDGRETGPFLDRKSRLAISRYYEDPQTNDDIALIDIKLGLTASSQ